MSRNTHIRVALHESLVDDVIALICAFAVQGRLILLGGEKRGVRGVPNGTRKWETVTDVAAYDPSTGSWTRDVARKASLRLRSRCAVASCGGVAFVFGGYSTEQKQRMGISSTQLDLIASVDRSGGIERMPSGDDYSDYPEAICAAGMLYVMGQGPGDGKVHMTRFDPRTREWTRLNIPPPMMRWVMLNQAHLAVLNGSLYALNAYEMGGTALYIYDSVADQWQALAPPPMDGIGSRYGHCIAGLDSSSSLFVCGGKALVAARFYSTSASCKRYCATTDKWTDIRNLCHSRHGAAAAVVDGHVYVCGGIGIAEDAINTIERYSNTPHGEYWDLVAPMPVAAVAWPLVIVV